MCEVKPGPRCSTDTRQAAECACDEYATAHPDGPGVDPLANAAAQFDETEELVPGKTFDFASWRLDEAITSIEKANRRLERAGIDERFTYTVEESVRTFKNDTGGERHEPWVTLTLNEPALSYGGYRFLAAVDKEEGGLVTRTAPGVSLDGWRPEEMLCEQCGRKQHRGKTYIVEGEDGQRKQLGTTCVDAFLGVKPTGLWALGFDPLENIKTGDDDEEGGGTSWEKQVQPVKETLALALALSDGGKAFVSRSRAEAWGYSITPTSALISDHLYVEPKNEQERTERDAAAKLAEQYLADGTVDRLIDVVRSDVDTASDWGGNLHVALNGEWVSNKQVGLLASSLTVWASHQKREAEKANPPTPGFTGPVGHKLKGSAATVTKVRHITEYDQYSRRDVTKSMVVMRDPEGHEMTWYASSRQNLEAGQRITFLSGSVKAHGEYQGVDQTKLTRVKWEPADGEDTDASK